MKQALYYLNMAALVLMGTILAGCGKAETIQPEGALPGVFSVSSTKQVLFSRGNLQAVFASAGTSFTWRFATNQYDFIGKVVANTCINGNGSVSAAGTVDLFGWSARSTTYGINNSTTDYDYHGDFREWGANAITNGGNAANQWRTLTRDEWAYLFSNHTWGMGTVHSVHGIIILPDSYSGTGITSGGANKWNTNTPSASAWTAMEAAGAVFLPAAGYRSGTEVYYLGNDDRGYYWSSTSYSEYGAHWVEFDKNDRYSDYGSYSFTGHSVRLVRDVN